MQDCDQCLSMLVLKTMVKKHLVLVDVKKMFLAIQLEKVSDKDMLRFVWAKPGSSRPDLLRYRVLAFGVVSSPYQAIWCLHETAKMFLKRYPVSAQIILDMTYMDDINITADSIVEAKQLTGEVLEILEHGGFYGHKISASSSEIVDDLDTARLDQSRIISVLGLKLNHDTCEFMFDLEDKFNQFDAKACFGTTRPHGLRISRPRRSLMRMVKKSTMKLPWKLLNAFVNGSRMFHV